jgi:hypothetical protein
LTSKSRVQSPETRGTAKKTAPAKRAGKPRGAGVSVFRPKTVDRRLAALQPPAVPKSGSQSQPIQPIPRDVSVAWLEASDHPVARTLRDEFPELTVRHRRFLIFYLTSAQGNASAAYRMAGYEPEGKQDNANVNGPRVLATAGMLQARLAIAPLLFGSIIGQLENLLYVQATEAVIHVPPVWNPDKYDKDGDLIQEGYWSEPPEKPDIKQRVQAAKDLKALAEGRTPTDEIEGQIHLHLDPRLLPKGSALVATAADTGYYPAQERAGETDEAGHE